MNKVNIFLLSLFLVFFNCSKNNIVFAANEETSQSQQDFTFDEVIVTAPTESSPLTVQTDPKAPRQPVPAADGGEYLKSIPGFATVRKGGTASDPVFRGLGGTRLNILLDGGYVLGGCPARMDSTTSYVFPESYDKISISKGPETVLYGGGNIAGTIHFDRTPPSLEKPEVRVNSSLLFGSFGRYDELLDVTAGDSKTFVRVIRAKSHADDYTDGNGNKVHSFYSRNSITGIIGFTPDINTLYEFSVDSSTAQAAYADRSVDGAKFDRTGYNFKFQKKNISSFISNVDFNIYNTSIDHIMDNYSLRPVSASSMSSSMNSMLSNMYAGYDSMEVKSVTKGGRLAIDLAANSATKATVGIDYLQNKHSGNMVMDSIDEDVPLTPDMTFKRIGLFSEINHTLDTHSRLIGGLRFDRLDTTYDNSALYANRGTDTDKTYGYFLRYEHDNDKAPITSYLGIGHAERPADWWERRISLTQMSSYSLSPEKNTQLDTGLLYHSGKLKANLSLFYSKINDFILITDSGSAASNINATLYGSEADLIYALGDHWQATATLAYTHGNDNTYNRPLPQVPPLEGTLGIAYENDKLGAGILWRGVAAQTRYDKGSGNEIGTDIGPSAGFGTLATNISYHATKNILIAAGVDNIFNKNYSEFISRNGAAIAGLGIDQTLRVNEPGRNLWMKVSYSF